MKANVMSRRGVVPRAFWLARGKNLQLAYRPFHVGVASRLATAIYVAMVTPILLDNSYSLNDSNLKYKSYWPNG